LLIKFRGQIQKSFNEEAVEKGGVQILVLSFYTRYVDITSLLCLRDADHRYSCFGLDFQTMCRNM